MSQRLITVAEDRNVNPNPDGDHQRNRSSSDCRSRLRSTTDCVHRRDARTTPEMSKRSRQNGIGVSGWLVHKASSRRRSGSLMMSISTILPLTTVNAATE